MNQLFTAFALASALAAVTRPISGQQVVTLEPVQDTAIFSNSGTLTSGGGALTTGTTATFGSRRALLLFDLGTLPQGATIQQVDFAMTMRQTNTGAHPTSLHPLLASWGEGTVVSSGGAGAAAMPGDATWTHRFLGTAPWASPGGDFVPSPLATTTVDQPGRYTWSSTPAMVATAQFWLDQPAQNFGWMVITDESATSAKLWNSRESALLPGDRPQLTITYTVAASVTPYGNPCNAATGPMVLSTNSIPTLGATGFSVDVAGAPASGLGLLFFGDRDQVPAQSFANCPVHIGGAIDFVNWGILSAAGATSFPLAIPAQTSLLGATVFAQSLGTDGTTDATSNGLVIRLGV